MRRPRRLALPLLASVLWLVAARSDRAGTSATRAAASPSGTAAAAPDGEDQRTWIEMRNVDLRVLENAVVRVVRLHGQVLSTRPGVPPLLDSTSSLRIRITGGSVAIDARDLATLMNEWVFAYEGAPLRRLQVRTAGSELELSGIMHKGVDLHFEQRSTVSLMPDGTVRMHPTRTRILGVDGMKLMHALGLKLSNLLDLSGSRGARVVGDDILLDPTKILPPPAIEGRLASIRVQGNALVQDFVRLPEDSLFGTYVRPDSTEPNLVYFRGGLLSFGKLTMRDTDLLIRDADPSDPLDLFLARYQGQLVAGSSRTMPNMALQVVFPDYAKQKAQVADR